MGRAGALAARRRKAGRMRRFGRKGILLVISGLAAGIAPAAAQFGGIFRDTPRPPSNVPNRPPVQDDRFMPPVYPQNPQPVAPAPPQAMPVPPPPSQQGGIQSQPLGPPPGMPTQPAAAPPAGPNAAPSAPSEVVTAPPTPKIANPSAVFAGLDKITGRITKFDVALNETVQFG